MQGIDTRWASVLLAMVVLAAAPALDGGFTPYNAKESKTSFVSGGQKITVWQFTPKDGDGPFPGIVMLYGLEGLDDLPKVEMVYKLVAGKIAEAGYVVHFVHYFDRSKISVKDIPALKTTLRQELVEKKDKADPQCEVYFREWLATVKDAVANLRANPKVNKDRIGLVGFSMGGFLATSTAVEYPELKLGAVVNAFGGLVERHCTDLRQSKAKIAPVFILGGEEDDIVPEKFGRDLLTLMRETGNKGEAHFYHGIGHMFFDKSTGGINTTLALKEALPSALRFLGRTLTPPKMEKK